MKKRISSALSLIVMSALVSLIGCQKDEDKLTAGDSAAVAEEATLDTYFQDIDGLSTSAIEAPTDSEYSGGRTSGEVVITGDGRFCDGVVVTISPDANSSTDHPKGQITIDFGTTGCADGQGNIRKGKLLLTYDGWRFQSGSTVTIVPENYFINGVKLEGTRTSYNITASETDAPKFNVVLNNGRATFPDNTIAERHSDITWSWIRGANPAQDKIIVHSNSTADGITRVGTAYSVVLLEQLQYNRFCPMAVSGIKKYEIDSEKELTIDYGSGDCDNEIVVKFNGITRTVTLG